jgi:TonB family protein
VAASGRWLRALAFATSVAVSVAVGAAHDIAQTGGSTRPSRAVGRTHNCDAFYPEVARRKLESGNVLIGYDVSADGSLVHVAVLKSSGYPELDLAASQCVSKQWRDLPATRGGKPVASPGHRALIQFTLTEPASPASLVVARGRTTAAPDASVPIVLILSGLGIMGLAGILARFVTRPRIPG